MGNCCTSDDSQDSDPFDKQSYINIDEIDPERKRGSGVCCKLSHCRIQHCRLQHACQRPSSISAGSDPSDQNEYVVPLESMQILGPLDKEQFGDANDGWQGALKVTIKRMTTDKVNTEDLRRDIDIVKAVSHPNIVRLHATCTEKNLTCILMEYMCNGILFQYLRGEHGGNLKLETMLKMATQIADGMKYLESHYLIHKCLSSKNILVGYGDVVKLANFGLIKMTEDGLFRTSGNDILIHWTAPEVLRKHLITIKSNVWSFGIILYELFSRGGDTYQGLQDGEIYRLITEESYRMPRPSNVECSEAVYEMMLSCWKNEPESRPTFDFLHHYFEYFDITSEPSLQKLYQ